MSFTSYLFLACLAAALYLTGLIWLVQVVQYPLFALVGPREFPAFHAAHSAWITPVVFVPMLVHITTALLLLGLRPPGAPTWALWIGAALAAITWASTIFIQVPQHNRLALYGSDPAVIAALVRGNWIRTLAWTAHSALLLWSALRVFGRPWNP